MTLKDLIRRSAVVVTVGLCGAAPGHAQERHARDWHTIAHVSKRTTETIERRGTNRALTINRLAPGLEPDDDVYLDGPVRYNNVRTFDPAPYADSGKQYPLGFDGIGGYGSDLGVSAGHDGAIYDRGF